MAIFNIFSRKNKQDDRVSCTNIVESIAKCKSLHKKLVILAHPDKHKDHQELAEELTKAINRARYDYAELLKLQKRVESELL